MLHPVALDAAGVVLWIAVFKTIGEDEVDDFVLGQAVAEATVRRSGASVSAILADNFAIGPWQAF